jgi:lipopolysaccharide biosynthesis glycosyltransferase
MVKIVERMILKEKTFNIYIGWDSREPIAADVLKHSIEAHTSIPVNIIYLQQDKLRSEGLYWRETDPLASTEFTFTRFLVPYLNNYEGHAIFVDCDFLCLSDLAELIEQADSKKAVQVVQHDYTPAAGFKMDGRQQLPYPRKNWSSMILWNCGHKDNQKVDLEFVNTATGQELHRFTWLKDKDIGNLSPEWNWLVGWYREQRDGYPKWLHFTLGGPWFEQYEQCEYSDLWWEYKENAFESRSLPQVITENDLILPEELINLVKNLLEGRRDPRHYWHEGNISTVIEKVNYVRNPTCMALIDADPENPPVGQVKMDPIVDNFIIGADGVLGMSKDTGQIPLETPAVIRGIAKRKVIHRCKEEGRDWYYIDTGYFGNGKTKLYHRVTKNNMQYVGKMVKDCPDDRFQKTGVSITKWRPGRKILLCPPSQKAMNFWNMDLYEWITTTIEEIKQYTDREIVIREKASRHDRVNVDTMEMALANDIHCMVTFNSIAAVESLIYGKPVFTTGPLGTNAAEPLSNKNLEKIESAFMPSMDEVRNLLCNLAYQQFTVYEMRSGYAWRQLNSNGI